MTPLQEPSLQINRIALIANTAPHTVVTDDGFSLIRVHNSLIPHLKEYFGPANLVMDHKPETTQARSMAQALGNLDFDIPPANYDDSPSYGPQVDIGGGASPQDRATVPLYPKAPTKSTTTTRTSPPHSATPRAIPVPPDPGYQGYTLNSFLPAMQGGWDFAPAGGGRISAHIFDRLGGNVSNPDDPSHGFLDMRSSSIQPSQMSGGGGGGAYGLWVANPAFLVK